MSVDISKVDVVWLRRHIFPTVPKFVHKKDVEAVQQEAWLNIQGIWAVLTEQATWVNPLSSYYPSNSKSYQLRQAIKAGLCIPETLVTNDRDSIIAFIKRNGTQGTIYKAMSQPFWKEGEGKTVVLPTVLVSEELIPPQSVTGLTHGIYQKRIEKSFEVRATFFGEQCLSVKLDNKSELDWRFPIKPGNIKISCFELPSEIKAQCICLMKQLNIVFGCFDFIVTPQEEYVFLEVNEMGQFLWVEKALPELRLLNTFCDFLVSLSNKARVVSMQDTNISLRSIEYSETYQMMLQEDLNSLPR